MYIPYGWFNSHRLLGRAADFCPLCRGFRPFRVLQVESVRRFYLIPISGRQLVGHSRVCESCGLLSPAQVVGYASLSTDPDADLETLIAETNPEIRRNWASRLLLEDRIKARKLTPGERASLLREPFEMANQVLARRDAEGRLDLPSNLGCVGSLLLPLICFLALPLFWKASGDSIELVTVVVGGSCVAFTVLALLTDARRFASKAVVPRLVEALRPLDPSSEEIDQILESLAKERSPLAEVVRPRDLTNSLLERWD